MEEQKAVNHRRDLRSQMRASLVVVKIPLMTIKITCCAVTNHCPESKFDQTVVLILMSVAHALARNRNRNDK